MHSNSAEDSDIMCTMFVSVDSQIAHLPMDCTRRACSLFVALRFPRALRSPWHGVFSVASLCFNVLSLVVVSPFVLAVRVC